MLSIRNVGKIYYSATRAITALRDVSLDIKQGELVSLLGPNGAGKTTLSSLVASLHPVTSGDILFQGHSIYNDMAAYRMQVGYCPQKPNFESTLTVRENLLFAGRCFGMDHYALIKRADVLLDQFELVPYADESPTILSGGYKQRLLIARTIMHSPRIVILDEPTVGLDPHVRRLLWDFIKTLKSQGVTVILTTHYLDEADYLSDRVCIINKGTLVHTDTPYNLKHHYKMTSLEDIFITIMNEQSSQGA